jgi:SAM-dependent methyltransferase
LALPSSNDPSEPSIHEHEEEEEDSHSQRMSSATTPTEVWKYGRRKITITPYLLPVDPLEMNRIDLSHTIYKAVFGNVNHLAPLKNPKRILDVGCGSAIWVKEMAKDYPKARVLGIDLSEDVMNRYGLPKNAALECGNVLNGLDYPSGKFDFIHQRLLIGGIPTASWHTVLKEYLRLLRPGGCVQIADPCNIIYSKKALAAISPPPTVTFEDTTATSAVAESSHFMEGMTYTNPLPTDGKALCQLRCEYGNRVFGLLNKIAIESAGIDIFKIPRNVPKYLKEAGFTHIKRRLFHIPIGSWGGDLGTMYANILIRMNEAIFCMAEEDDGKAQGVTWKEFDDWCNEFYLRECDEAQCFMEFIVVTAKKPVA